MTLKEHQALIKANIEAAEKAGDKSRAAFLRLAFGPLLIMEFPPEQSERIPASPINPVLG